MADPIISDVTRHMLLTTYPLEARQIAARLRERRSYAAILAASDRNVRKFGAALLVGAVVDELLILHNGARTKRGTVTYGNCGGAGHNR